MAKFRQKYRFDFNVVADDKGGIFITCDEIKDLAAYASDGDIETAVKIIKPQLSIYLSMYYDINITNAIFSVEKEKDKNENHTKLKCIATCGM